MIPEELKPLAALGVSRRPDASPTIDDVLLGISKDRDYALRQVLLLWHHQAEATGFKPGDVVRMLPAHVHRGDADCGSGWAGFAPVFSDHTAVVDTMVYDTRHRDWVMWVTYEDSYRTVIPYGGDEYEPAEIKPRSFMVSVEWMEQA